MNKEDNIVLENKMEATLAVLHSKLCITYPPLTVEIDFLIRDVIKDAYFIGVKHGTKKEM